MVIPRAPSESAIDDLCKRVRHLLDTCNNRSLFANKELWRKRARGCVETVASLAFCANVKLEVFGDPKVLARLLRELIEIENTPGPNRSPAGSDGSFVTRWACLSLVVVTRGYDSIQLECAADLAIDGLSRFQDDGDQKNADEMEKALESSLRIDHYVESARHFCVYGLREVFSPRRTGEQVREVLARDSDATFSMFDRIALAVDQMKAINRTAFELNRLVSHGLSKNLPGVFVDVFKGVDIVDIIQPIQFYNLPVAEGQQFMPQFLFLGQRL